MAMDVVGDPGLDGAARAIVRIRTFYIKFWDRVVDRISWKLFSWQRFTHAWGGLK